MKKLISVMTPCYNEEGNIEDLYLQVRNIFVNQLPNYEYEHVFIDNCSEDKTVSILKELAKQDTHVKIIVNARNFGFVRSSYYGLIQPDGDSVIFLMADLQDPPSLIIDFVRKWEEGYRVVQGIRSNSRESFVREHPNYAMSINT